MTLEYIFCIILTPDTLMCFMWNFLWTILTNSEKRFSLCLNGNSLNNHLLLCNMDLATKTRFMSFHLPKAIWCNDSIRFILNWRSEPIFFSSDARIHAFFELRWFHYPKMSLNLVTIWKIFVSSDLRSMCHFITVTLTCSLVRISQ